MKLNFAIISSFLLSAFSSDAAIYYVSNLVTGTGSSESLYQNAGAPSAPLLNGGIVALGYFTSNAYTPSSNLNQISTTIGDFTIVAFALTGSASNQLSAPGVAGYVDAAPVDTSEIASNSALVNRPLYVFVGNAATLSSSSAWALKQVSTIVDDEGGENEYFANPFGGAAPVIGTIGSYTGEPYPAVGAGPSTFQTLQLAVIPEPSISTIIGSVAVLLFFRRRRS